MGYTIETYHGEYNRSKRSTPVRYIVVHYVGGGTSAAGNARNNCIYFSGGNRNASAHYFIDDASIYEYANPAAWACWHVGDGHGLYGITNSNSIGIEVCNNGGPFTEAEIDRLTWLTQNLMRSFNVPAERVVEHWHASRKKCPLWYVDNPAEWDKLHARITGGKVNGGGSAPAPTNSGLSVDGYWGSATTRRLQQVLGTPVDGIVSSQSSHWKASNPALTTGWQWTTNPRGSQVIMALQRKLGVGADGMIGPNTIKALQRRMGTTQDGVLSKASSCVMELQRRLNKGTI